MHVNELIKLLGGVSATARKIGYTRAAVSRWETAGVLPDVYSARLALIDAVIAARLPADAQERAIALIRHCEHKRGRAKRGE